MSRMKTATLPLKPSTKSSHVSLAFLLIPFALVYFALSPQACAVSPAPDGCYPNFTTAEGCDALDSLTTGSGNTGLGWRALFLGSTASFNTGVGAGALTFNNADSNTAVGAAALLLNTNGAQNIAVGTDALVYNDSGSFNNAVGAFALFGNVDGLRNNAFGNAALTGNIHASDNTAIGNAALFSNDATGTGLAHDNTAIGADALFTNIDGALNTATGRQALYSNTNGFGNTANGAFALLSNTLGGENTACSLNVLLFNSTGSFNTAIGSGALFNNSIGSNNTALGELAGSNLTTGDNNIDIGYNVVGIAGESNIIRIGNQDITTTFIRGISGSVVSNALAVYVDSTTGHLGTLPSSARFKDQIKPMDKASEAILALKPVTFRYKHDLDPIGIPQFGLVAEDVAKVNSDLIVRDKEGKPYSVRYDQVNAMLLNEFLKEHRKVESLEQAMAEQQKESAAMRAMLKQQAAQIQRVSAQVELNKAAPQTVMINQ
jgi:hypothetical protein